MGIELSSQNVTDLVNVALRGLVKNAAGDAPTEGGTGLVGEAVFIRTVTFYYTGRLVDENSEYLVIEKAAWIADTGRWSTALASGELNEVEPFPEGKVLISKASVVDICAWAHPLPRERK